MSDQPTIRRGTPADSRAAFDVFVASITDLATRRGIDWNPNPEQMWSRLEPLLAHLAEHAAEWWVADDPSEGRLVGYARSIERGGLFELSEFFVRPGRQSAGIGGQLLERAFPADRGDIRAIIATTDVRAQARYYRAGTVARFPIAELAAPPKPAESGDVHLAVARATASDLEQLAGIEEQVLGYPRHADYPWLLVHREAYLYRRGGNAVGFAFVSERSQGPIAALHPGDQPAILLHVEGRAHELGVENLSFEVPMINEVAMRHLLGRGFRIDPFLTLLMSNAPFGRFDRFIGFSPPFVL